MTSRSGWVHTTLVTVGYSPTDWTGYVDQMSVRHGRNDITEQPSSSVLTIDMSSVPASLFGGAYGVAVVGQPIRASIGLSRDGGLWSWVPVFNGFLSDVDYEPDTGAARAIAVDRSGQLARTWMGDTPWPLEYESERATHILDAAGLSWDETGAWQVTGKAGVWTRPPMFTAEGLARPWQYTTPGDALPTSGQVVHPDLHPDLLRFSAYDDDDTLVVLPPAVPCIIRRADTGDTWTATDRLLLADHYTYTVTPATQQGTDTSTTFQFGPAPGQWHVTDTDTLLMHPVAANGVDISAELADLDNGDTITIGVATRLVDTVTQVGPWWQIVTQTALPAIPQTGGGLVFVPAAAPTPAAGQAALTGGTGTLLEVAVHKTDQDATAHTTAPTTTGGIVRVTRPGGDWATYRVVAVADNTTWWALTLQPQLTQGVPAGWIPAEDVTLAWGAGGGAQLRGDPTYRVLGLDVDRQKVWDLLEDLANDTNAQVWVDKSGQIRFDTYAARRDLDVDQHTVPVDDITTPLGARLTDSGVALLELYNDDGGDVSSYNPLLAGPAVADRVKVQVATIDLQQVCDDMVTLFHPTAIDSTPLGDLAPWDIPQLVWSSRAAWEHEPVDVDLTRAAGPLGYTLGDVIVLDDPDTTLPDLPAPGWPSGFHVEGWLLTVTATDLDMILNVSPRERWGDPIEEET